MEEIKLKEGAYGFFLNWDDPAEDLYETDLKIYRFDKDDDLFIFADTVSEGLELVLFALVDKGGFVGWASTDEAIFEERIEEAKNNNKSPIELF